jgi:hypothetical protein
LKSLSHEFDTSINFSLLSNIDALDPATEISNNILVIKRMKSNNFSIDFVIFNILRISQMDSDLFNRIITRV